MLKKIKSKLDVHTLEVFEKSLASIIVKIIGVAFGLALSIFIARTIGAEGLGIINLSNRIITITIVLALFGMRKAIVKEVAIALSKNNLREVSDLMYTSYWFNGLITVAISVILILLSPWIANSIFKEPKLVYPLTIALIVMTPQVFSRIFSSGLIGYKKIWQSNLVDQALSICFTVLLILLAWLFNINMTINVIATCYAIGRVGVTVSVGLYWKKLHNITSQSKIILNKLLKIARPLFFVSIAGVIINSTDIVILGLFSDSKDIGIYVVAARLSLLTSLLIHVTNSAMSPKIAAMYSNKKIDSLKLMIKKVTKGLFIIGLLVYFFFVLFGEFILSAWGQEFKEAYSLLLILGFGQFINLSTGAVGVILIMTGHEKIQRNISILFMFIFLILIFSLTPIYGTLGAAIAVSITIAGINIVKLLYVKKLTSIELY